MAEIIICRIIRLIIVTKSVNFFDLNASGKVENIFGTKYKAHKKIKINFGMIIESLLIQGEIAIVVKDA